MFIGVNVYSFSIGNATSIIANMDSKAALLNSKLSTLSDYAQKYSLPLTTQSKIKNFFENQARSIGNDGDWDSLFEELPPSLRTDVLKSTRGQIIKGIRFFRDKPQEFLLAIIPKLKNLNLFDQDILYSEGDQAEEIFFIFHGKVILYVDLSEFIDMSQFIQSDSAFNVPLAQYSHGSYFGDNDVILQKNGYRSNTGICQGDSQIYSIKNSMLEEVLDRHQRIKKTMHKIADEKQKYYQVLKDELKIKYKSKRLLEQLYLDKQIENWTDYISLKRKMVKKQNSIQNKMGNTLKKKVVKTKDIKTEEELQKEKDAKTKRNQVKKLANQLGQKDVAHMHLDKYTDQLRTLIGRLHDENLDSVQQIGGREKQNNNIEEIDENELIQDSDDEKRNAGNNKKLEDILKNAAVGPTNERKEKLKIRLLNESQTYYQNNLNIFINGLSLLSVNSLEVHGLIHQINGSVQSEQKLAVNIEAHSKFMKEKTEEMVKQLKEVQAML